MRSLLALPIYVSLGGGTVRIAPGAASVHNPTMPTLELHRHKPEAPIDKPPRAARNFFANVGGFRFTCRCRGAAFLLLLLATMPARAGMQDTLDAIRASKFRSARAESEMPFIPLAWLQNRYYPNSTFESDEGNLAEARVAEYTFGLGTVLPAYVAERDMLLLGGDLSLDYVAVKSGPYADQCVLTLTPVMGWLHQFGEDDLVGAFIAPMFSYEMRSARDWGFSGYCGVVGAHYFSDTFQLLYGGVYQNSFGDSMGYPYLGVNWLPTPRWSIALVFPWPTISYAASDCWLVQLGVRPGGASWTLRDGQYESTQSLSSWDLTLGANYRFYEKLWLSAGIGVAGFRGVTIESEGTEDRLESKPGMVISLAIQFRP
jgi:hypothetical protein